MMIPTPTCRSQYGAVQGMFQRLQTFTFMDNGFIRQFVVSLRSFNEFPSEVKDSGIAHLEHIVYSRLLRTGLWVNKIRCCRADEIPYSESAVVH